MPQVRLADFGVAYACLNPDSHKLCDRTPKMYKQEGENLRSQKAQSDGSGSCSATAAANPSGSVTALNPSATEPCCACEP